MSGRNGFLGKKFITGIRDHFVVPSYQRGYRWKKENVELLLDDLHANGDRPYCLQPVVVKKTAEKEYELVDGQQRLTTIYLLYSFFRSKGGPSPAFSISYQTREKSEEFLKNIDSENIGTKEDNIDFWFFSEAYEAICAWFNGHKEEPETFRERFEKNVYVIWYEVEGEDSIELFKRLNRGKIPLTNAELVKAMFLSKDTQLPSSEKQEEIAVEWDRIERELQNDQFWYFLTGNGGKKYQTRIDFVLELMADEQDEREPYHIFFWFYEKYFDKNRKDKEKKPESLWSEIQTCFLLLKSWFEDDDLYHKIGYLIASKSTTVRKLAGESREKRKSEFREELDRQICRSIETEGNIKDLKYDENYDLIQKILLLFNVETIRRRNDSSRRFSFAEYNHGKNGKPAWSLEHIHAQCSKAIRGKDAQTEWLKNHKESLELFTENNEKIREIIEEIDAAVTSGAHNLSDDDFENLRGRVIQCLTEGDPEEYVHLLENLALLTAEDNSSLNNDAFDVKRRKLIWKDQEAGQDRGGMFVPYCTMMAFLKYYSPDDTSPHFWTQKDRDHYINRISTVLAPYLTEKNRPEAEV